jgi:hypothetical protein
MASESTLFIEKSLLGILNSDTFQNKNDKKTKLHFELSYFSMTMHSIKSRQFAYGKY